MDNYDDINELDDLDGMEYWDTSDDMELPPCPPNVVWVTEYWGDLKVERAVRLDKLPEGALVDESPGERLLEATPIEFFTIRQ